MKQNNIPKIIHYCWFGKNLYSEDVIKCIESWKKYLPEYEIKKWDESNYDVNKCQFIKEAYEQKKWAFVSDYARLDIIYNYGGIYLDTDVEVIKSFDDLLDNEAFFGFELSTYINSGLGFGAKKKNNIIKENFEYYNNLKFINEDGTLNMINCPSITTNIFKKYGVKLNNKFQVINNVAIYPPEYFCPMSYYTGELNITENTHSIHRYSMSWLDEKTKRWKRREQKLARIIGIKLSKAIIKILSAPSKIKGKISNDGLKRTINYYFKKYI